MRRQRLEIASAQSASEELDLIVIESLPSWVWY
jgi:hypothetical protein